MIGLLLFIAIYNVFHYLKFKDKAHLYYVLFQFSSVLTWILNLHVYNTELNRPIYEDTTDIVLFHLTILAMQLSMALFIFNYFQTKTFFPHYHKLLFFSAFILIPLNAIVTHHLFGPVWFEQGISWLGAWLSILLVAIAVSYTHLRAHETQ